MKTKAVQQLAKFCAGATLARLFPNRTTLMAQGFTLPEFAFDQPLSPVDRLIRQYLGARYRSTPEDLERLHCEFWKHQNPTGWYQATKDRIQRSYVPIFGDLVEGAASLMDQCQIHNVIEFGTGNGDWLNYLRTKWNTPQRFLGIDLATQQIEENRTRYPAFEFMSGDLTEWVKQNRTEHTVFVTHCGVLEYLSEASLQRLLNDLISLHRKSVLFWIEPIAADFDLQSERYSQTLGNEFSFSHPYPTLIRRSGFELQTLTEKSVEGFRMLCLTAIHPDFNVPGDLAEN